MMYLMSCGHRSNSRKSLGNGKFAPICVMCGCTEVVREVREQEGLEGRKAKCQYCDFTRDSKWGLAFFEYRPELDHDCFYCGCRGWD